MIEFRIGDQIDAIQEGDMRKPPAWRRECL